MKKNLNLIFSILLIISMLGASPILSTRNDVEGKNNIYQIAIDSTSLDYVKDEEEIKEFFDSLKKENVSTLTFTNMCIKDLATYRDLKYMTVKTYLEDAEYFDYEIKDFIPKYASKEDMVIMISKADFTEYELNLIESFLSNATKKIENDEDLFFYINETVELTYKEEKIGNPILSDKFFINTKWIDETYNQGMSPMLSITNSTNENIQEILLEQILDIKEKYGLDKIQMPGKEVIGNSKNITKFLEIFKKNNISIVTTEFQTATGLNAYLKNGLSNLIRGHEVALQKLSLSSSDFATRVARAVKERNIRVIVISDYIDYKDSSTITTSLENVISGIKQSQKMLDGYDLGIATNYDIISKDKIAEIFAGLASASLLAMLVFAIFNKPKQGFMLSIVSFILMFGFTLIANNTTSTALKAYALLVSIIGACSAIIVPYKSNIKQYVLKFILSGIIALIGGLLVACIMYGTDYILKLSVFSGVKILYIMPPLLIAIWCIIDLKAYKISFKFSKDELIAKIKSIKWYHIIFVVLVAVVGIVYIKRSGNSGNASSIEMAMRNALEEIFYVRPRTKEFMLGYPAILIAFFMLKRNIKNAQYLLIVGSIGTMSTVNTFTHLHTPIVYSLLRSIYGIGLGLVLGYAVIIIVGQTMKFIRKKKEL